MKVYTQSNISTKEFPDTTLRKQNSSINFDRDK